MISHSIIKFTLMHVRLLPLRLLQLATDLPEILLGKHAVVLSVEVALLKVLHTTVAVI